MDHKPEITVLEAALTKEPLWLMDGPFESLGSYSFTNSTAVKIHAPGFVIRANDSKNSSCVHAVPMPN